MNNPLGTAASASWKMAERLCRTTFAPIFTSFSRSAVSDQRATRPGSANVCGRLARLSASVRARRRTALARKAWHDSRVQMIAFFPPLIHCPAVPR